MGVFTEKAQEVMNERFGQDSMIALATVEDGMPSVRTVDGYYTDGAFYVITDASSNKMRQIGKCPVVGICGDWFTAHGIGESLGYVGLPENAEIMKILRTAFAAWYRHVHTDETNTNTVILRIRLTDGVLFDHGTRHDIDFTADTEG